MLAEAGNTEERPEVPTHWARVDDQHICSARPDAPVPRGAVFETTP